MYRRQYYREIPSNYSGVTFSQKRQPTIHTGISEEKSELGKLKASFLQSERATVCESVLPGRALTPLIGDTPAIVWVEENKEIPIRQTGSFEEKAKGGGKEKLPLDDLVLIGALLFLLGEGLDEESVLVLLAVLMLLTGV